MKLFYIIFGKSKNTKREMNKLLISSLISLILVVNTVQSQDFDTRETLCENCDKELFFRIQSTSFLKNNEYFNDFAKGFTGIGFFVQSKLEYYVVKNTKLNAGIHFLKYSGIDNFSQVIPLFSVQQKLGKHLDLVFGNLYGTLSHRIKEPLFRFDRYYQDNVEYGLQFLYHSKFITSDLWVNWEKYIFKKSPFQEKFTVGSVSDFTFFSNHKIKATIPLQMLFFHKGGQIDTSSKPISTIFNGAVGLDVKYLINNDNEISFEPLFFAYKGLSLPESGENSEQFSSGRAFYIKTKYRYKNANIGFGYWNSEKFIAPKGEYLFLNVSEHNPEFSQKQRKLITSQFSFSYRFSKSVNLVFIANAYFDLNNSDLSHSAGLYLLIDDSFLLYKKKKYQL